MIDPVRTLLAVIMGKHSSHFPNPITRVRISIEIHFHNFWESHNLECQHLGGFSHECSLYKKTRAPPKLNKSHQMEFHTVSCLWFFTPFRFSEQYLFQTTESLRLSKDGRDLRHLSVCRRGSSVICSEAPLVTLKYFSEEESSVGIHFPLSLEILIMIFKRAKNHNDIP